MPLSHTLLHCPISTYFRLQSTFILHYNTEDFIILSIVKSIYQKLIMKVSLACVFIATSTIAVVVNSEINPRHRFLKAKASKDSQTKASKSKSSKSKASKECTGDAVFNECEGLTNPSTCVVGACRIADGVCVEVCDNGSPPPCLNDPNPGVVCEFDCCKGECCGEDEFCGVLSGCSSKDLCADVDCSGPPDFDRGGTCFSPINAVCNPNTGLCEGVPDNEFCPQTSSQCSENICGVDGLCLSNDINEGDECSIVGGNACTISTCKSGSCNSIIKECSIPGGCNGNCNSITGDCVYPTGETCTLSNNVCLDFGQCTSSGSCVQPFQIPCAFPRGPCQREVCDATDGCNAEDNTNNGGACGGNPFPAVCCNGECCPAGQTCQDIGGVSTCGGS